LDYLGENELWDFGKLSFSPMYSTTYGRKMMGVIPSPDYPPRYVAGCHWLPCMLDNIHAQWMLPCEPPL